MILFRFSDGSDIFFHALLLDIYLATLNFLSNIYLLYEGENARPKKRRATDAVSIEI